MAYTKTNWVNEGPPAIDADNLNKIEQGIFNNDALIQALINTTTPDVQPVQLDSNNWTSGVVSATKVAGLIIIGVLNIRRSSVTGGYIDVGPLPDGFSVGDFVAGINYINDGGKYQGGGFRVSNGVIQASAATAPTYGYYAFYIYEAA